MKQIGWLKKELRAFGASEFEPSKKLRENLVLRGDRTNNNRKLLDE